MKTVLSRMCMAALSLGCTLGMTTSLVACVVVRYEDRAFDALMFFLISLAMGVLAAFFATGAERG